MSYVTNGTNYNHHQRIQGNQKESMTEIAKTPPIHNIEDTFVDEGDGPVVLLLHGFPFDRSMWSEQVEFLSANGFRAIAPELLGGTSDQRQVDQIAPHTMDDMARQAAALLDRLQIESCVVCGLSMGGYVAFEFARLFPTRTRALILAGTRAPADNPEEKAAREQQATTMLQAGMTPIAIATLTKLLAPPTLAEKPAVVARVRKMIFGTDPRAAAAAQRGMAARRDYSADLAKIDVPTLIIVGREDQIRPVADAEFMHRGIPNSRLEIIEDAAHLTNMEQAEVFNRSVLTVLEQLA
jgi:pimeloyl-ACP methyl ester carboxylesterase